MTKIINSAIATEKDKFRKDWEIGAGLGVHGSDIYIPVKSKETTL